MQASTATNDAGREPDIAEQLPVLPEPLGEVSPPADAEPARSSAAAAEPNVETTASTPPEDASKAEAAPAPDGARPAAAQNEPAMPVPAVTEPKADPAKSEPTKSAPARTRTVEPVKRTGQVAVFVSKKEKKIFVRHAHVPIFDMPIEIADPDQPLGTHVFTAMEVLDNGTRMRWNAITMPAAEQPRKAAVDASSKSKAVETSSKNKKNAGNQEPAPRKPAEHRQPSTAQQALDRINLPQEAVDLISELLGPGSSLIVSDEGLGKETGRYTEFIVLTR